ncbi:acyl-CoA dehydrogenase family protein [Kibdelosporangium phytohabitans]|uniref:Acyl-CoA dehydrogenase n=1 Tax=Kibdelosporangium phytohabitans TaxID=860235 RepID=A0A0N9I542_9PSEU|nr:acyl-CoA dehydrogenase family protein [Kibdelosporangium phytohabitans]ALG10754.1 acyl-CoA dehydrogenase [Kibdelosporangium phytohabitans]MBE1461906.1 3-hydroxy-9,10-secoandrosta-1,3,5(10)-triene-9,17-dione monooxygenase [Kibdelosporangium phytohabitans]
MTTTTTQPDRTAQEVVARAEAIAAKLVDRQAETEERTYYAPETHDEFVEAGLYRLLVPRRYGGLELGAETFARVCMAITRGCPSSGWLYMFGAAHSLVVGSLFGDQAQRELFAVGDFICPATVAPSGSATRVDGGWVVNGTWRYCSGAPYATHFMGHTLVQQGNGHEPTPLMFVVPRESWRLENDWGAQLGLRGSGSHGITVTDAFVPEHHTREGFLSMVDATADLPGRALHSPEYGGGPLSFMLLELGILAVGMAKGALDAYADLMRSRTTMFMPIVPRTEDPDFQFRYGEATGMIAAAEAAVIDAVRQWSDLAARGGAAITRAEELRLALIGREAVRLCWRAVEGQLFPTAGSSSIRSGERFERVWRDMSMLHSHAGLGTFLASMANRELAKAHFGLL